MKFLILRRFHRPDGRVCMDIPVAEAYDEHEAQLIREAEADKLKRVGAQSTVVIRKESDNENR